MASESTEDAKDVPVDTPKGGIIYSMCEWVYLSVKNAIFIKDDFTCHCCYYLKSPVRNDKGQEVTDMRY